jgi:uncharacterized protein (UPF0333 family)
MLTLVIVFVIGVLAGGAGGYLYGAKVKNAAAAAEAQVKKL